MATFCYKCPSCGSVTTSSASSMGSYVCYCGTAWKRDYRAEAVGIGSGVKVSRDGTNRDFAQLMLPGNDEFKGPGDPDGHKGMRAWRESHTPVGDNKKPYWPGEVERTTF